MARKKQQARKSTGSILRKPIKQYPAKKIPHKVIAQKAVVKKRRKPGANVLKEIKRYQMTTDNLIPFASFSRVSREITALHEPSFLWRKTGMLALQEAAEAFLVQVMEDAYFCALHAKRVTLMPRDIRLAMRLNDRNLRI
eukprot:TRINITY_DN1793_c0_g1_i1.p7 TRINITY_DN1793_c0_g1~~TRINITY_DN1793_c0_g1_i1.p7  ORF type:complete len:140 (-),score=13.23 TRINITY_DN1793_c0_g1_i1:961-1380(-)